MKHVAPLLVILTSSLLLLMGPTVRAKECQKPTDRPFKIFNGLFYKDQPDLSSYGLLPVHIIDRKIWAPGVSRLGPPDPEMVKRYVEGLPKDDAPIVLDFEDYDLTKDDAQAQFGIANLLKILQAFRRTKTRRAIGYYGYVPLVDYWRAVTPTFSEKFIDWQTQNDRASPLAKHADALFPSIYTYYTNQKQWVTYATAQICEARRLSSKPVYVFIWPNYHNQGDPRPPRVIAGDYWRLQLDTV